MLALENEHLLGEHQRKLRRDRQILNFRNCGLSWRKIAEFYGYHVLTMKVYFRRAQKAEKHQTRDPFHQLPGQFRSRLDKLNMSKEELVALALSENPAPIHGVGPATLTAAKMCLSHPLSETRIQKEAETDRRIAQAWRAKQRLVKLQAHAERSKIQTATARNKADTYFWWRPGQHQNSQILHPAWLD